MIPPILGLSLLHATIFSIVAIWLEYAVIRVRHIVPGLLRRVIVGNLLSLIVGLAAFYTIPNLLGESWMNVGMNTGPHTYGTISTLAAFASLASLFLTNVLIEYPAYIIGQDHSQIKGRNLFLTVLIVNAVSNAPVIFLTAMMAKE